MNLKKIFLLGLITLLGTVFVSCDFLVATTEKQTTSTTLETQITNAPTSNTETTEKQATSTTLETQTTNAPTSNTETTLSATDLLESAANMIIITNQDNMLESFTLPAEVNNLTVTWVSSNNNVISVSDTVIMNDFSYLVYELLVTRPNQVIGDQIVTLTGTFYYGESTYTRDYVVRVPAIEDATIVTNISDGLALDLGTYITWKDMTVIGIGEAGFFFTDGIDILYVYNSTFLTTVKVGSVYNIKGGVELYYNIPEVKTIDANVIAVTESTNSVRALTPSIATVSEAIANHNGYDDANPMELIMYTITAKVYYNSDLGDHGTYLIPTDALVLDKSNAIRIYYKSNLDAVTNLAGQIITLDIVLFGYNGSSNDWYAYFLGDAEDINVSGMTDADKLAISQNQLEDSYDITSTFELPELTYGNYTNVTISTEISNYLSYTSGVFTVTRPDSDTDGILLLTLEYNAESVTLTINITMKAEVVVVSGTDIFISQYIEGSSYNKYIEIYNGTDATVDLSEYTLEIWSNGSSSIATEVTATMTLTGNLSPGEVIVISRVDATIYTGIVDIIDTTKNIINFNGNDILILKHNGDIIDSIGQIGNGDIYAKDVTLIRKSSVTGGDTNPYDEYNPSLEWDAYAKDSIFDLGTYTED